MEKINLTTNQPVVHIYEGQLPKPIELKSVEITGRFDAINNWLSERSIDKVSSHIVADIDNGVMTLMIDEKHPHYTKITAKIERNKQLLKLGIETDKRYSNKELSQVLRTNRILFSDIESHSNLLQKLNSFSAKAQTMIDSIDDKRGNDKSAIEHKLESEVPPYFTLNTPVIQGGEPKMFQVSICMEIRDKGVSFWLESPEMEEIFVSETKNLMTEQASKISGIAIVWK